MVPSSSGSRWARARLPVGVEGDHDRSRVIRMRQIDQLGEYRLVTTMEAVKDADRDDARFARRAGSPSCRTIMLRTYSCARATSPGRTTTG